MITKEHIEYFLRSRSDVGQLDTIEISHPNFTKTYYMVRNHLKGFTATLEDGTQQFFEYVPMQLNASSVKDDLDQSLNVTLGDVVDIVAMEIDNVQRANAMHIKPLLTYRTYKSNDFTRPLTKASRLEVSNFQFMKKGVSFDAIAQSLNVNKTGELYTKSRFPMLAGVT